MERDRNFVADRLPWLVALGALVTYLFTLNPWITPSNVAQVIKVSGWDWRPVFVESLQPLPAAPLLFLLTAPLRLLPDAWIPFGLNALAALCAAATLALLARCVALLPRDRTPLQRQLEHDEHSLLSIRTAWMPPVLAVVMCGFQLTFWENATAGTGHMLNLLLFAYGVRCLLEYRLDERQRWLDRAALVCGAGMANNWGMIAFLPMLLLALIWLKRFAFFQPWFLMRLFLFGLLGLSLYLVMPLMQVFDANSKLTFWQALHFAVATNKNILFGMFTRFYWSNREVAVLLMLTTLLPVLLMSIRWSRFSGDSSPLGNVASSAMIHVIHGLFLLACLWIAFDPPFSPRQSGREIGIPLPFLSLYFLSALAIGYYSGYFLLVFGSQPSGRQSSSARLVRSLVLRATWVIAVVAAVGLLIRNLPVIRGQNRPFLRDYAALAAQSLPPEGGIVLSDDVFRLALLEGELARRKQSQLYALAGTQALSFRDYHEFLRRKYPGIWTDDLKPAGTNEQIFPVDLVQIMTRAARSNTICYLHPSFGYYFEAFYPQTHNLVYALRPYSEQAINPPPLTEAEVAANQAFWQQADESVLRPLAAQVARDEGASGTGLLRTLEERTNLKREDNWVAALAADYYSRALTYWGVQLQRAGKLPEAARHFERAIELKPENVVAQVNLAFNENLQSGVRTPVGLKKKVEDQFERYRTWEEIINNNGPFDEPSFVYELGRAFAAGGNYRQAAQQFDRVIQLAPDNLPARLWLAELYNLWRLPDRTLEMVAEIRAEPRLADVFRTNPVALVSLEATAYFIKTNLQKAGEILESALVEHPENPKLLTAAALIYVRNRQFSNALEVVERHLALTPSDPEVLLSKGFILLSVNDYTNAIAPLTKSLTLKEDNYQALYNRAIAYLRLDNLDAAQADYEQLQAVFTNAFQVYYGLGEVAYRKKDTNAAIQHYQSYLSNAVPDSAEAKMVSNRLKELTGGKP